MKKLLITGGSGFLGTHLSKKALERGYEVVSYDLKSPNLEEVEYIKGDVRNFDISVLEDVQPTALAHLAGILGTAEQVDNPQPSVKTNIMGTLNVLGAMRNYRPLPGLQLCNGNYEWYSTYPITKEAAAKFALMYDNEFGIDMAVLRIMNAYGEWQKTEPIQKIIPTFAKAVINGEPIEIFGDGTQIADLVYAGDVAEVMMRTLEEDFDCYDKILEVGSRTPYTVNEVADAVIEVSGADVGKNHVPMRPGEPEDSVTMARNPEELKMEVGYLPDTGLKEGLGRTMKWYEKKLS